MADEAHEVRDCATSLDCAMHFERYDRWLAARDREVAAKALRDAADAWHAANAGTSPRAYQWLWDRADRIESQANEKGAGDVR